ncbi:hypothetical protein LCGC14_1871300, partial [marine sediment metagenome]
NTLFVNSTTHRVGIGTISTDTGLNVVGGEVYDGVYAGSLKGQIRIGDNGEQGGIAFARSSDGVYTGSLGLSGANYILSGKISYSTFKYYVKNMMELILGLFSNPPIPLVIKLVLSDFCRVVFSSSINT